MKNSIQILIHFSLFLFILLLFSCTTTEKSLESSKAVATVAEEDSEIQKIFNTYKVKQKDNFKRLFFVEVDASEKELGEAMKTTKFVIFLVD